jgi:hypothetical protein
MKDEEKKGETFSVTDKRRFVADDAGTVKPEGETQTEETGKSPEKPAGEKEIPRSEDRDKPSEDKEVPLFEIDFATFVFSLSSSALFHLGLMENPYTKQIERNLPLAKQTIDIIAMLNEKTKGNLSPEEENLIVNLLTDLRLKYVEALKKN